MAAATTAWSVFKTFSTHQQVQQTLQVSRASDPMICVSENNFKRTEEIICPGPLCRHLAEKDEGEVIFCLFLPLLVLVTNISLKFELV